MNNIEKKKINDYKDLKTTGIQNIIIGTSAITLLTPIYISNVHEENISTIILTLFGVGFIYLPLDGIKKIIKANYKMKLIKNQEINNKSNYIDNTCYLKQENKNKNIKKKIKTL